MRSFFVLNKLYFSCNSILIQTFLRHIVFGFTGNNSIFDTSENIV